MCHREWNRRGATGRHKTGANHSAALTAAASLANPDSPPSFAARPGTFLFFMILYLGLCTLGIWLIAKGNAMPPDKRPDDKR